MKRFFLCVLALAATHFSFGQADEQAELYRTILSKDSLLFNVGFNTCDVKQFENLLSDNFEFFHDKDSISYKSTFLYNIRNGLCASPTTYQSRRKLVEESTEIYPLYKGTNLYGAIQVGEHQFYETMAGKNEQFAGAAQFTHVWVLERGEWKLLRSLSYDHKGNGQKTTPVFGNEASIEQWLKEKKIPTLGIGLIENGKLQEIQVFGEMTKGVAAPYNTIFNVASLTKPVTALVALKLVSLGKWNLDEPLYKYWTDPDIANDPRHKKLTTRLVLSHQTGFLNWRYMSETQKLGFQFDPGTQYQYSGEGMEYLRKALENKFKKSLQALAAELIFVPLNLHDTRYIWDKQVDTTRLAPGYNANGQAYEVVKRTTPNAADDLLTTIEDYGNFLVSVLNGDGLSKAVFEDMQTHQVATTKGKHFGLGFEIYDLGGGEIALSHGGSDSGVQTLFFIFPKTKSGLLIFTNSDTGVEVYETLIKHYLGQNGQKIIDIEMK